MKLRTKFQDEDFELGEVVEGVIVECLGKHEEKLRVIATAAKGGQSTFYYNSIKKFMDDWEDAPTEEVWYLGERIGNYSMPKKEAREATEKILAWERLKDKGFRIRLRGWKGDSWLEANWGVLKGDYSDVRLLLGGEE